MLTYVASSWRKTNSISYIVNKHWSNKKNDQPNTNYLTFYLLLRRKKFGSTSDIKRRAFSRHKALKINTCPVSSSMLILTSFKGIQMSLWRQKYTITLSSVLLVAAVEVGYLQLYGWGWLAQTGRTLLGPSSSLCVFGELRMSLVRSQEPQPGWAFPRSVERARSFLDGVDCAWNPLNTNSCLTFSVFKVALKVHLIKTQF